MNLVTQTVSEIIGKYSSPADSLISVLEDAQKAFGCLPDEVLKEVAERTNLALVRVLKAVENADGLVLESYMKEAIEICTCPSCSVNGGGDLLKGLREILLVKSCCHGVGARYFISMKNFPEAPCANPPSVKVKGRRYHGLSLSELLKIINNGISEGGARKSQTASL